MEEVNTSQSRSVGPPQSNPGPLEQGEGKLCCSLEVMAEAEVGFLLKFILASGWWQDNKSHLSWPKVIKPDGKMALESTKAC